MEINKTETFCFARILLFLFLHISKKKKENFF